MKATLYVELVGWDKPPEIEGASETYVELIKEVEIHFTPFVGLNITFSDVPANRSDVNSYRSIRTTASEKVLGIFEVETVRYDADKQLFRLYCNCHTDIDRESTLSELNSVVEQLIVGYGFTRNDVE